MYPGWEEWMGERPDLSRVMYNDLWYGLIFVHPEIRSDPGARVLINMWAISEVTGRYERREIETIHFWVDIELEERRKINHEAALAHIKQAHTRELLLWLDLTRSFGGWYSPCQKSERHFGYRAEDIKAELATREHIPNKVEARNLRRAAALMHRKNKLRCSPGQRSKRSRDAR